jgi:hypothetical protein
VAQKNLGLVELQFKIIPLRRKSAIWGVGVGLVLLHEVSCQPQATMTPAESVKRLRDLIKTLGPAQSGRFFNHDGREHPW